MKKIPYPHAIKFFSAAAVWGIFNYIPIFAKSFGISDAQIGLIASAYAAAVAVSTYLFGRLADTFGRRTLIIAGLLLSALSFLLYNFASDFTSLLAVRVLSGIAISIHSAALVAYAHDAGHKLGRLTSFEALGIAIWSVVIGIAAVYSGINAVFIISAALSFAALLVSFRLENTAHKKIAVPLFPYHIIKKNLPVYVSFSIRHAAANSIWVFWGLYLLQLGADLFLVGLSMAINTFTQFVVMYKFTDKIKVDKLIKFGTILSAVTFLAYGLAADIWQVLFVQVILGTSWAFLYVGSIRWVAENTREKATGIGLLGSFLNMSMIAGTLIATSVIVFGGYRMIMYVAAALAFGSFIVFDVLARKRLYSETTK